jgi:Transcription factor S-II (TFIIS), central domain/SPOC domain/PHD-finger
MAGKHTQKSVLRALDLHTASQAANIRSTDEATRRSGRATKGQNSKARDISEDIPATKKKGKGKANKAKATEEEPEEEEDENIRCVCGEYDPDEEGRAMICCDECEAWQHNNCMGLEDDYEPAKYFCEIHGPQDHKELLAAIKRGEQPWIENRRRMEAAKLAKSKKGGKKGRKSGTRVSEAPSRASPETEDTPVKEATQRGKRKLEESPMAPEMKVRTQDLCHDNLLTYGQDIKKARATPPEPDSAIKPTPQRKSSSMAPTRSMSMSGIDLANAPTDVKELKNAARKGVAQSLIKLFVTETKDAVKTGAHTLPAGVSADATGTQLALRVEYAMYMSKSAGSPEPNEAYKDQARSISFNVKKNHELRDALLSGDLSEAQLASMTAAEMASEEQQRKDAETKMILEKQHTIIQEQGPRIRRTHKGEEFVNEADQIAAESTENRAQKPQRRESGLNQDGDASINDPNVLSPRETDTKLLRHSTGNQSRVPQRQSSNFNIDNVWETVQGSPDTDQQAFPELPQQRSPGGPVREPVGPGAGADADIDRLLKDEDAESEPYSPRDDPDGHEVIWRGVINGKTLGQFNATAKYAAGATPDALQLTWQSLIPHELPISGRIEPSKANEYLCGLQYSTTSDVIVVTVGEPTPSSSPSDLAAFERIFEYFSSRNRFGVITQTTEPAIKDIYLIPLQKGDDLPEMLKLLEEKSVGDENGRIPERMLMIPIVVKNTELPHLAGIGVVATPTMHQTPMTPYDAQAQAQYPGVVPYPHQPPLGIAIANGTPTPNQAQYPAYGPPPYGAPPTGPGPAPPGLSLAQTILGPLATAPAVAELLRQVPQADEHQLLIVREICQANPQAALDLTTLTAELRRRGAEQSAQEQGQA